MAKAEKELGWKPLPIAEWYPITVAYFEGDEADDYEAGHDVDIAGAPFNDDALMAKVSMPCTSLLTTFSMKPSFHADFGLNFIYLGAARLAV